jgi:hypothetical protein
VITYLGSKYFELSNFDLLFALKKLKKCIGKQKIDIYHLKRFLEFPFSVHVPFSSLNLHLQDKIFRSFLD